MIGTLSLIASMQVPPVSFVSLPCWQRIRFSTPSTRLLTSVQPTSVQPTSVQPTSPRRLPVARIALDNKSSSNEASERQLTVLNGKAVDGLSTDVTCDDNVAKQELTATNKSTVENVDKSSLAELEHNLSWLGYSRFGWAIRVAIVSAVLASAALSFRDGMSTQQYSVPQELVMPDNHQPLWEAIVADPHFAVSLGLGVSAFVQSLTGFGFAIVSVGALSQIDWIAHSSVFDDIQPIAATLSGIIAWILVLPEIRKVNWKQIAPLIAASTICTPIGAGLLELFNAELVLKGLGLLISSYVVYAALDVKVPKALGGKLGSLILGGAAGIFGGAFDISGPPLVVHGQAAGWTDNFKRNLLTVLGINSTVVVLCDWATGRLQDYYYGDFLINAAPWVVAGMILGSLISRKLNPAAFKKIVLGTCFVMGLRLLLS